MILCCIRYVISTNHMHATVKYKGIGDIIIAISHGYTIATPTFNAFTAPSLQRTVFNKTLT